MSQISLQLVPEKGIAFNRESGVLALRFWIGGLAGCEQAAAKELNVELARQARQLADKDLPSGELVQARTNLVKAEEELAELHRTRERLRLERESLLYKSSGKNGGEQLTIRLGNIDRQVQELTGRLGAAQPGLETLRGTVAELERSADARYERSVQVAVDELLSELEGNAPHLDDTVPSLLVELLTAWFAFREKRARLLGLQSRPHGIFAKALQVFPEKRDALLTQRPQGFDEWAAA
jgi:hypothetical protein